MTTNWTKIPKAASTATTTVINPGNPIGLLLALTYATTSSVITASQWTNINKASGTNWTKVTKAT